MTSAGTRSLLLLSLALAACVKPLGTFETKNVSIVAGEHVKRIEPYIDADPETVRVEFTSKTNLFEATKGGDSGLYVLTSFCPFDPDKIIYTGNTYFDDRNRESSPLVRPIRGASGQYTYTTYLRLRMEGRPERPGMSEKIAFDLERHARDLCMQVEHPSGMISTPSRSKPFVVPAKLIQRAIRSRPAI